MSLKYCLAFCSMSLAFMVAAGQVRSMSVAAATLSIYVGVSFQLVGAAYGGILWGAGAFGKREDGRLRTLQRFLLGPYQALNQLAFLLYRTSSRESAYAVAAPNIYFGRRLTRGEARHAVQSGWTGVIDLACEFAETPELRHLPRYCSAPVLDATAPTLKQLHWAVNWLRDAAQSGPVYVHCALGHGRTGSIVIAYLLSERRIATVEEGIAYLKTLRSGTELNAAQRRRLKQFEQETRASSPSPES